MRRAVRRAAGARGEEVGAGGITMELAFAAGWAGTTPDKRAGLVRARQPREAEGGRSGGVGGGRSDAVRQ